MIFCDMDGVLADFDFAFKDKFGIVSEGLTRKKKWGLVTSEENYWLNLPKMKDADVLFKYLSKFDFTILTGAPPEDYERAEAEKRLWMKMQYNKDDRFICCLGRDKCKYCKKFDILIDDLKHNIVAWEKKGGTGILHTSANDTIAKLKELGY